MGHVIDIDLGTGDDTLAAYGANVVGFAVVVPGNDLGGKG